MTFDTAVTPKLVLLPGLDGTGKLFADFLKAIGLKLSAQVVPYPSDVPLGYDELELLVRAGLPVRDPSSSWVNPFRGPWPFVSRLGRRRAL